MLIAFASVFSSDQWS